MKARRKLESHSVHGVNLAFLLPCRAIALTKTQAKSHLTAVAWAGTVHPIRGALAVACKSPRYPSYQNA